MKCWEADQVATKSRKKTKPKTRRLNGPLAAAVAHPVRTQALAILGERVASPAEIAKEVDVYVGNVGYHVSALSESNLVEEVGCRPVRGAVEHFFKAIELVEVSGEEEAKLSKEARGTLAESVVALFAADVAGAIKKGTYFERTDQHITREVRLTDAEGYEALKQAYMTLIETVQEIYEESAERMAEQEKPKAMRVVSFMGMLPLPKVPKGEAPALASLQPPISSEDWDGDSTNGDLAGPVEE
jgi:DNA-binding transcriptional ArsR family regulator